MQQVYKRINYDKRFQLDSVYLNKISIISLTKSWMFKAFLSKYNHWLITYPIRTKMATSGNSWVKKFIFLAIANFIGDSICQLVFERRKLEDFDVYRTLRQAGTGMCFAPIHHFWYGFGIPTIANKSVFVPKQFKTVYSVLVDQSMFAGFILSSNLFMLEFMRNYNV